MADQKNKSSKRTTQDGGPEPGVPAPQGNKAVPPEATGASTIIAGTSSSPPPQASTSSEVTKSSLAPWAKSTEATGSTSSHGPGPSTQSSSSSTIRHNEGIAGCTTDDCQYIKNLIDTSVDRSKDPCNNFYEYACGAAKINYAAEYDLAQGGTLDVLSRSISESINRSMDGSSIPTRNQKVIEKCASFFRSCLNAPANRRTNLDAIKGYLESERMDLANSNLQFDSLEILAKFNFELEIPLILEFALPRETPRLIIRIDEHHTTRLYMTTWSSRGRDQGKYVDTVLSNIYHKAFAESFLNGIVSNVTDVIRLLKHSNRRHPITGIPISKAIQAAPGSLVSRRWNAVLGRYVKSETPCQVYADHSNILRDWIVTENATMKWFMAWRTAEFLHSTLGAQDGKGDARVTREKCYGLANSMFPFVMSAQVLFASVGEKRVNHVKAMFGKIIDVVVEYFPHSTLLANNNRKDAQSKLQSLHKRAEIGYASYRVSTEGNLTDFYRSVPDLNGPFIMDFISASEKTKMYWSIVFAGDLEFAAKWKGELPVFDASMRYDARHNKLTIPPAMMMKPVYALEAPPEINYGTLGRLVVSAVMLAFDDDGQFYKDAGQHEYWFNAQSNENFGEKVRCLTSMVNARLPNALQVFRVPYVYMADVMGTEPILGAYQNEILGSHSRDELFYLSWCLLWCGKKFPEARSGTLENRCNLPLMNTNHFTTTFSCTANALMNPRVKCTFW
ncbi:neprilysin-1-like isoform X2 [Ornithodoros turicata]|uniref:neprilysin-1-like isoform X2 n=1 Tax=Ornithodoros turicata TaxID=34597 RepID=UPI0031393057